MTTLRPNAVLRCFKSSICFVLLLALPAGAQENSAEPTFRTGTELVQVSVIAQDKDGKPVTDLQRQDFQIFDNGTPQEIRLFMLDKSEAAPDVALPPGVFTNQIVTSAHSGYSVLLFDNLNIDQGMSVFAYTARARQKALQALKAIPPGDKIAVYSLWCRFQVVREFTSDRDSLLQRLDKFAPGSNNCINGGDGPSHALTEGTFIAPGAASAAAPAMQPVSIRPDDVANVAASIAAGIEDRQVELLAEHLAGIPGRKNLIWLTTTFRLKPSNLRKLMNANVAVYPVDTVGSTIGLHSDKERRYASIRALAALTGGKAYLDRDDLDVAIGDALNDGRASYTIGFYRPDQNQNAANHRIEVRTSHDGVLLRYRTSYPIEPPALQKKGVSPVQVLVDAIDRPVDAIAIPMRAAATRSDNMLDLALSIDPAALDLQQKNGLWTGQAELVARFTTVDGKIAGKVNPLTMSFHLRPVTYTTALQRGLAYHTKIAIPPKAIELKVLVGNLASGKIGTLTIPMAEVRISSPAARK